MQSSPSTGHRKAKHRKSDRRRACLCANRLRKRRSHQEKPGMAEGVGFEPRFYRAPFDTTNLPMKMDIEKTSLDIGGCYALLVMHYAKHSSSTGQAVLVLRIFDLQSRNSHQQARLSLHENSRQKAGARNLPRVAQGRAQSAQRQAERGRCARSDRARCQRRVHGGQRRIAAECFHQSVVRNMAGSQSNRERSNPRTRVTSASSNASPDFSASEKQSATFPHCKRATLRGFVIVRRKNSRARPPISA